MNPALAGVALAVVVGAVVAGSARDARTAIFGLVIVLLGAPFLADPTAAPLGLTARLVGVVLAGHPAVDRGPRSPGPHRGIAGGLADRRLPGRRSHPAVVGYGSEGLGAPAIGPSAAAAAGFALAALAILPVVTGRDILRVGIGLLPPADGCPARASQPGRHPRSGRAAVHGRAGGNARRGRRDPGRRRPRGRPGRVRDEPIGAPPLESRIGRPPRTASMSLLAFVVVAFGFAGLAIVVRMRVAAVTAVGLLGLAATFAAAVAMDPGQLVRIGETAVATTAYLRQFLILGSLTGLGLAIAGTAAGTRRDAPAVTLAILGAAGLTLGVVDVRAAVLAATAGGLFGVLVTLVPCVVPAPARPSASSRRAPWSSRARW